MEVILIIIVGIAFFVSGGNRRRQKPRTSPPAIRKRNPTCRTSPVESSSPAPPVTRQRIQLTQEKVVFGPAYVTDGDGLRIKGAELRLFGVDAPEANHPFGKKSKFALLGLCKGQEVMAIAAETDHYGRLVARCFLSDGRDLSAEMVKLGLALDWPKFSGGMYGPFETPDARKKLWLADARQKGRMHVWEKFEAGQRANAKSG